MYEEHCRGFNLAGLAIQRDIKLIFRQNIVIGHTKLPFRRFASISLVLLDKQSLTSPFHPSRHVHALLLPVKLAASGALLLKIGQLTVTWVHDKYVTSDHRVAGSSPAGCK
jgi:hypothetical protein